MNAEYISDEERADTHVDSGTIHVDGSTQRQHEGRDLAFHAHLITALLGNGQGSHGRSGGESKDSGGEDALEEGQGGHLGEDLDGHAVHQDHVDDVADVSGQQHQTQRAEDLGTLSGHDPSHQAENADGGDLQDEAHDGLGDLVEGGHEVAEGLALFTSHQNAAAEEQGHDNDLEHGGVDHRIDEVAGEDVHDDLHDVGGLGLIGGILCQLQNGEGTLEQAGDHKADHAGDGGGGEEVRNRLPADGADLLYITRRDDPADHGEQDHGDNYKFEKIDKNCAERLQVICGKLRDFAEIAYQTHSDTGKQAYDYLSRQRELLFHYPRPPKFDAIYVSMNPGYKEENLNKIKENAKIMNIDLQIFDSDIFAVAEKLNEEKPCYMCARMRRGFLYSKAKELGCNKIVLGHHFDDVIETTLLSMLYGSEIKTMLPKLHSDNFENMELIRPLYYVKEEDIISWKNYNELDFLNCACSFTDREEDQGKRKEVKELIRELKKKNPNVDYNIFNSTRNVNLDTIVEYRKNGIRHTFLDDYDDKKV